MKDTLIAIGHEEADGVYDWITCSIAMAIKNVYLVSPKDLQEHIVFDKKQKDGKSYVYGTTAIDCIREHRHFIGFELSEEYYTKAIKRIENELAQPTLF